MPDQSFGHQFRLRTAADFDRVYRARTFAADDVLVINACSSELPHPHLGLSISRKVGGAVTRNGWKRLIREAFRLSRSELPPRIDLVVRPQKGAAAELTAIQESLTALANRLSKRLARMKDQEPTPKHQ